MLVPAYRNLIKLGIPFKKIILLYRKTSCKDIFSKFYGIGYYFFKLFFMRTEMQFLDSQRSLLLTSNEGSLKTLNHSLIKKIPAFKLIQDIVFFNLVRHELIKSNKGYRLMKLLPLHGQRTWSNSKTSRKLNNKVRVFVHNLSNKSFKTNNLNKNTGDSVMLFSKKRSILKKKIINSTSWS